MLKISRLALLSGVLVASTAHAEFYVGPRLGPAFNTGAYSSNDVGAPADVHSAKGGAGTSFFGGLGGGYMWSLEKFRIGLDAAFLFNTLNNQVRLSSDANGNARPSATLKNNFFYQVAARFGYALCNETIPFISLGLSGGTYKLTLKNAGAATRGLGAGSTNTLSKQSIGFMPGVGVLIPLSKTLMASFEYNAALGSKLSQNFTANGQTWNYNQRITQHTLALGLNWKF